MLMAVSSDDTHQRTGKTVIFVLLIVCACFTKPGCGRTRFSDAYRELGQERFQEDRADDRFRTAEVKDQLRTAQVSDDQLRTAEVSDDELSALDELQEDPEITGLADLPQDGQLFEGDIVMDSRLRRAVWGQKEKKSALAGLADHGLLWPRGVVPFEIDPNFPAKQRRMLAKTHHEFHTRTCIQFRNRLPGEKDYVYYTNWKDECSSNIGKTGGRQNITLGKDCGVTGTYEHENMHALGFIHEHSRPDRDDYLKVEFKNIKKDEWVNFQKYEMPEVKSFDALNFASIMLYRNDAFTKNGHDTLKSLEEPDLKFGQRVQFSSGDVRQINLLYNCEWDLKHPNYHHLYKTYHTRRRRKKDMRKDKLRRLLKRMLPLIQRLREQELEGRRREEK